ncbi:hypothetical protein H4S08_002745 [Coemansia sp. RSA 1365]|nr:hypothetical protein H4S08_002745 [Coemansia sp. RSA 1365]
MTSNNLSISDNSSKAAVQPSISENSEGQSIAKLLHALIGGQVKRDEEFRQWQAKQAEREEKRDMEQAKRDMEQARRDEKQTKRDEEFRQWQAKQAEREEKRDMEQSKRDEEFRQWQIEQSSILKQLLDINQRNADAKSATVEPMTSIWQSR